MFAAVQTPAATHSACSLTKSDLSPPPPCTHREHNNSKPTRAPLLGPSQVNHVLHDLFPTAITIGEDVSGMPTFCR